jgi:hypothetical protein
MRDQEDGTLYFCRYSRATPSLCIEMVGGLVEEKQIRLLDNQPGREIRMRSPPRKLRDGPCQIFGG